MSCTVKFYYNVLLGIVELVHYIRVFVIIDYIICVCLVQMVALLTNNSVESCQLDISGKKPEPERVNKLTGASHRTDVRTICFSSDNTAILSASGESVKIWNRLASHVSLSLLRYRVQ